jgi:hypothetical protein
MRARLLLISIWVLLNLLDLLATSQGQASQEANVLAYHLWQTCGFWAVCLFKAITTGAMIAALALVQRYSKGTWCEGWYTMILIALASTGEAAIVAWNYHILLAT